MRKGKTGIPFTVNLVNKILRIKPNNRDLVIMEEQGWCNGESTRLPHTWPEFDFQTRSHVRWVCCWFSFLLRGFFYESSGSLPFTKANISKFQFDLDRRPAWKPTFADVASSLNKAIIKRFKTSKELPQNILRLWPNWYLLLPVSYILLASMWCHYSP